ncbi:hypothetical protein SAMN04489722_107159 [Algibacter lectus]|uniref:hypothetical protein n=1 Tax=Algibacter lectus TaxID=221126 RepID=UPI0008F3CF9D|nr:hypothetical protein [Algibacter lectus]SFD32284.1 hypothetical protein SAMN04489722_107159 [Algibacter lectus]
MRTLSKIKVLLVLAFSLFFINCSKDSNSPKTEDLNENNFSFKLNSNENFENELSLQIKNNDGQVEFTSTKTQNNSVVTKIKVLSNSNELFTVKSNKLADTLIVYYKDGNGVIESEGFRFIIKDEKTDVLELIEINPINRSIIIKDRFELERKEVAGRSAGVKTTLNDSSDELEEEVYETGEFLSDPTNTHPITAFWKGIVIGLKEGSTNLYNDSAEKLGAISNRISNNTKKILDNLSKVTGKLNEAKQFINNSSKDFINTLITRFTEGEISDDDLDEIFNYLVLDCNGVENGSAFIDECNTCVEGNTGKDKCVEDCNGVLGGAAYFDDCEECVGGETGIEECAIIHPQWAIGSWKRWDNQGFVTNIQTGCWTTITKVIDNETIYFRYYPKSIYYYEFLADGTVEQKQPTNGCEDIPSETELGTWSVKNNVLEIIIRNQVWLKVENFTENNTSYDFIVKSTFGNYSQQILIK